MKTDNSSFEMVEEFKYMGTHLTHQNSIQKKIKNKLNSGNAYYHSVQNLLSSRDQSPVWGFVAYVEGEGVGNRVL
jgi:hypothetical protein